MQKLIALSGIVLALIATGCVNRAVPASEMTRTPLGDFRFPKNAKIEGLTIQKIGTNFTIQIQKYESANDADVIDSSGRASALMMREGIKGASDGLNQAWLAFLTSQNPTAAARQPAVQGPPAPKP